MLFLFNESFLPKVNTISSNNNVRIHMINANLSSLSLNNLIRIIFGSEYMKTYTTTSNLFMCLIIMIKCKNRSFGRIRDVNWTNPFGLSDHSGYIFSG